MYPESWSTVYGAKQAPILQDRHHLVHEIGKGSESAIPQNNKALSGSGLKPLLEFVRHALGCAQENRMVVDKAMGQYLPDGEAFHRQGIGIFHPS